MTIQGYHPLLTNTLSFVPMYSPDLIPPSGFAAPCPLSKFCCWEMEIHFLFVPAAQYPSTGNICDFATDVVRGWIGKDLDTPELFARDNVVMPYENDHQISSSGQKIAPPA